MKHQTVVKNILVEREDKHALTFTNPVPVFLDRRTQSQRFFTRPLEHIGEATLEKREDGIYATIRVMVTGNAVKGLFPNVGMVPIRKTISGSDEKLIEGVIKSINISRFTNIDKTIPAIKLN